MVDRSKTDNNGAINVQGFTLPISNLVSAETRSEIQQVSDYIREASESISAAYPPIDDIRN